jgi:hypothetical protein
MGEVIEKVIPVAAELVGIEGIGAGIGIGAGFTGGLGGFVSGNGNHRSDGGGGGTSDGTTDNAQKQRQTQDQQPDDRGFGNTDPEAKHPVSDGSGEGKSQAQKDQEAKNQLKAAEAKQKELREHPNLTIPAGDVEAKEKALEALWNDIAVDLPITPPLTIPAGDGGFRTPQHVPDLSHTSDWSSGGGSFAGRRPVGPKGHGARHHMQWNEDSQTWGEPSDDELQDIDLDEYEDVVSEVHHGGDGDGAEDDSSWYGETSDQPPRGGRWKRFGGNPVTRGGALASLVGAAYGAVNVGGRRPGNPKFRKKMDRGGWSGDNDDPDPEDPDPENPDPENPDPEDPEDPKNKPTNHWQKAGKAANKAIDERLEHARQDRIENQKERLLSLRPFLATAGTDLFDVQQDEEADRLKMHNLTMGQVPYYPLGIMDNKLALSQMATDGMRYAGDTFTMPTLYSGGTLTNGATLYGSIMAPPKSVDIYAGCDPPGSRKRMKLR